jgi:transposase
VTCWRRLRDWQVAGVWDRLHELLLAKLRAADQIDFSRAAVDSSSIRAVEAGQKLGQTLPIGLDPVRSTTSSPMPTARPLAAILTGANLNDVTQLLPLIDAIHRFADCAATHCRDRVWSTPTGYDSERHRKALRNRGIEPVIAKRRTEHGSGLGKYRWVVERTHAWLHHFRRLRIRFERRADIHGAFLKLGCCLICWNTLRRAEQSL